jgi:hypothetical protein
MKSRSKEQRKEIASSMAKGDKSRRRKRLGKSRRRGNGISVI